MTTHRIDGPGAALGEGPLWDERVGRLWWVDIVASILHCFDPDTGRTESVQCDEPALSLIVPVVGTNGLLASVESGLAEIDPSSGATSRVGDLSLDAGLRMNDGNVDPQGRLWAGSMAYDFALGAGALHRIEHGRHSVAVVDVTCSNGVGWSPDGELMYFVDTATQHVAVYDFDGSAGTIDNGRTLVEIDADDGGPDGIAIDADGGIWVALWNGGELRRYAPDGELTHVVVTAATHPTCPEFGGVDLDVLYFTAAAEDDGSGGGLFRLDDVGVSGLPPNHYNPGP